MLKAQNDKPRVGISSCLYGASVRFNGNQVRSQWEDSNVAQFFELIPVCPEVGAGLGIPREPVSLKEINGEIRMIGTQSGNDVTTALMDFTQAFLAGFQASQPHGFIFRKKSPSCGLGNISITQTDGKFVGKGAGLFAAALQKAMPYLPVEEDGRLHDAALRDNFFERVYAYQDFLRTFSTTPSVALLMDFHGRHKMALMARDVLGTRALGRMVAAAKQRPMKEVLDAYLNRFSEIMKILPSVGKHANVLEHLMGYVKKHINSAEKRELLGLIRQFQKYLVPLSVPLTLLRHHLRKISNPWIEGQSYLWQYPSYLRLHQVISKPSR